MRKWHIRGMAVIAMLPLMSVPMPAKAACAALSLCSCTVSSSGMAFGNYVMTTPASTNAMGTVRVQCTLVAALAGSYTIALSSGSSASYTQRTMKNGGASLAYNLYTSAAHSQVWGDGTGVSQAVTNNFAALLLLDQSTTVYGRIPAGQNVAAGAYTDAVVVTITF